MIIFLSELQKEHLRLLHQHSTPVLVDFCKLAIDYLNNGANQKKYSLAAAKLDVPITVIQNLVHALTCLIVEGCKHNLLESDFKSSLAIAGFSSEQQDVLVKLYNTKKSELSEALHLLQVKDPSYLDFTWRFEVEVASRSHGSQVKPIVSMDFLLTMPKQFRILEENKANKYSPPNDKQCISAVHLNVSIQEAKTASHCQNVINHILLQCDLPNLIHLTNKLDQALKESKTQHVRKVQRSIQ